MSIPSEYYELVEAVRDDQTVHSIELVDDEYLSTEHLNDLASMYMDTLEMERCKGEQPVYELVPMPTKEPLHVTAECIQELPDEYAGWAGFIMLARMNDGRELAYLLEIMQEEV